MLKRFWIANIGASNLFIIIIFSSYNSSLGNSISSCWAEGGVPDGNRTHGCRTAAQGINRQGTPHSIEPCRPLLSHAALYWVTPHSIEPRRTLLSHAALYWSTPHSHAALYWAMPQLILSCLGIAIGYQSCSLFNGDPEVTLTRIVPPPAQHAADHSIPLFVGVMSATKFLR
jgi:hypothetical protein